MCGTAQPILSCCSSNIVIGRTDPPQLLPPLDILVPVSLPMLPQPTAPTIPRSCTKRLCGLQRCPIWGLPWMSPQAPARWQPPLRLGSSTCWRATGGLHEQGQMPAAVHPAGRKLEVVFCAQSSCSAFLAARLVHRTLPSKHRTSVTPPAPTAPRRSWTMRCSCPTCGTCWRRQSGWIACLPPLSTC